MLMPAQINERWSLDFVSDALTDSRRFRTLCVVDDFTRDFAEASRTAADNANPSLVLMMEDGAARLEKSVGLFVCVLGGAPVGTRVAEADPFAETVESSRATADVAATTDAPQHRSGVQQGIGRGEVGGVHALGPTENVQEAGQAEAASARLVPSRVLAAALP
jgi:hypothetical protein